MHAISRNATRLIYIDALYTFFFGGVLGQGNNVPNTQYMYWGISIGCREPGVEFGAWVSSYLRFREPAARAQVNITSTDSCWNNRSASSILPPNSTVSSFIQCLIASCFAHALLFFMCVSVCMRVYVEVKCRHAWNFLCAGVWQTYHKRRFWLGLVLYMNREHMGNYNLDMHAVYMVYDNGYWGHVQARFSMIGRYGLNFQVSMVCVTRL